MVSHRVLALVSGGKDSCFSMLECVAAGHSIVALANLKPHDEDENELDSYMYQTVGHQAIHLYAEAVGLPLHRGTIKKGRSINTDLDYQTTIDDEVEDLYRLLKNLLDPLDGFGPGYFTAVCSGAILSDYQRIRVEHVCSRLGLVSLSYLWRRDQADLLDQMVANKVESVLIKTATLGLDQKHLGMTLGQVRNHLHAMNAKFGVNICGEGGEYETLTLDCPLFRKKIVLEDTETEVIDDVSFLKIKSAKLIDKNLPEYQSQMDMLRSQVSSDAIASLAPLSGCKDVMREVKEIDQLESENGGPPDPAVVAMVKPNSHTVAKFGPFFSIANLTSSSEDPKKATCQVFDLLIEKLREVNGSVKDLVSVNLMVASMGDYAVINSEYVRRFGVNPPVRVCVQGPISNKVLMSVVGSVTIEGGHPRQTMHVQGISHWAPANIGPYSQAVKSNGVLFMAGQIGMVPGTLDLVPGGSGNQARLSMRSLRRVMDVFTVHVPEDFQRSDGRVDLAGAYPRNIGHAFMAVCYVTSMHLKETVIETWKNQHLLSGSEPDLVIAVVPALPKGADVEWHLNVDALDVTLDDAGVNNGLDELSRFYRAPPGGSFSLDVRIHYSENSGRAYISTVFDFEDPSAMLTESDVDEWIRNVNEIKTRVLWKSNGVKHGFTGQVIYRAKDQENIEKLFNDKKLEHSLNVAFVPTLDLSTNRYVRKGVHDNLNGNKTVIAVVSGFA